MARVLRYALPPGPKPIVPAVPGCRVIPTFKPVTSVSFRSGADLKEIVSTVAVRSLVRVTAAVGAGKTTYLPLVLARDLGKPVLHVLPHQGLVAQVSGMVPRVLGVETSFSCDADFGGFKGVKRVTSSALVSRYMREGSLDFLRDCILYIDESHECDAYTYLVRTLIAADTPGTTVLASATHGVGDYGQFEMCGQVRTLKYGAVHLDPRKWDARDDRQPWSISNVCRNKVSLIYTDERDSLNALINVYKSHGISVYHLDSSSSFDEFNSVMTSVSNDTGVVVMILDSSYRSGFSFHASMIIDTAQVRTWREYQGDSLPSVRSLYHSESYQTMHRVARSPEQKAAYYMPDVELPVKICTLMAAEAQAAAFVIAYMGRAVPPELITYMPDERLFIDSAENLLNGSRMLSLQSPMRALSPTPSFGVKDRTPSPIVANQDFEFVADDFMRERMDRLTRIRNDYRSTRTENLQYGQAYMPIGIPCNIERSPSFPAGRDNVRHFLARPGWTRYMSFLSRPDYTCLVGHVASDYTEALAHITAISRITSKLNGSMQYRHDVVDEWVNDKLNTLVELKFDYEYNLDVLRTLCENGLRLAPFDGFESVVELYYKAEFDSFDVMAKPDAGEGALPLLLGSKSIVNAIHSRHGSFHRDKRWGMAKPWSAPQCGITDDYTYNGKPVRSYYLTDPVSSNVRTTTDSSDSGSDLTNTGSHSGKMTRARLSTDSDSADVSSVDSVPTLDKHSPFLDVT